MAEKIKKIVCDIANWICIVSLFMIIVVLMIVVVGRYFFQFTPSWSEEFSLFLLTWVGLFSSCIAENNGSHIRLSFIDHTFPPIVLKILSIIRYFLKLFFFGLMLYYGIKIFSTTKQMFGAINLSYKWQILPGIFTAAFCLIFLILNFRKVMTDRHKNDAEKELEMLLDE